jgi:type I restriction enzyme S subunit
MNNELRPYPEYKDSGLPWLGWVPAHWDVRRNGRLFAQRNETGYGSLPILEVSLKTGVRVRDMDDLKRKQVMSDREKYKRAVKGDIAYNMMRMWQGAVGVAPEDGLVSPAYVVARPYPEAEPRYFSYLFRTDAYKNEVDGFSRGIVKDRNRLYWEDFKRMPSCFPPPDEQKAIADFLDANAVKVRRFIRNRRRLIEVLNEQKQAIISRAVTRGLDPNAPLRPSSIDWLGDIPEHWELMSLRRILRVHSGDMIAAQDEKPEGYPIYGGNGIRGFTDHWNTEGPIILLGRVGAKCGCVHLVEGRFWASEHALRVVLLAPVNLHFLALLLRAADLNRLAIRTAQPLINSTIVRTLDVALPPQDEQAEIANRVADEVRLIDQAIDTAEREIDLIREYRTRLIADVVTGKVDVRGLAPAEAPLDDEQIDEGIEDDEMLGDDEPELVEEGEQ